MKERRTWPQMAAGQMWTVPDQQGRPGELVVILAIKGPDALCAPATLRWVGSSAIGAEIAAGPQVTAPTPVTLHTALTVVIPVRGLLRYVGDALDPRDLLREPLAGMPVCPTRLDPELHGRFRELGIHLRSDSIPGGAQAKSAIG
ncbi:MAG: hypothetical protein M3Y35_13120 [Actinomycetota bacterium]|nr:hypothetical protein [Actinomycetota bacterium]